jgi:cardiolipin synthase
MKLVNLGKILFALLLPISAALLCSCGNLAGPSAQNSPPKTVALDPLVSSRALAKTTFRSTVLAAIKQPVTTLRQGIAVLWLRPAEILTGNLPKNMPKPPAIAEMPGTATFENLLDENDFPKAESGTLKWLVDGKNFFGELDRQIAAARQSIRAQVYIFDNDDIAVRYADKLRKRSREIDVDVLYDDFGTASSHLSSPKAELPADFQPPSDMKAYLKQDSDIEVRMTLNPWLIADHTKLILFDNRTAILGGMNIGREYYNEWHDLMVRIDGPVVAELASIYSKAWRKSGPLGDLSLLATPKKFAKPAATGRSIPIRLLRTDAGQGHHEILNASLLAIRGAKKRILIQTPYFASSDIVLAVRAAALRDVDVRVVLPNEGDSVIMDASNLATARTLIEAGAKVYRYPRMTHLKVMVCDGWATMGSANLDTLSMKINRELNIAFSDKTEVGKLVGLIFRPDIAASKRIRIEETKGARSVVAEIIADQL